MGIYFPFEGWKGRAEACCKILLLQEVLDHQRQAGCHISRMNGAINPSGG
jgi:hypothetical protein